MKQCSLMTEKELRQNQDSLERLCSGEKNVLVKAEWSDLEAEPYSQTAFYLDREKEYAYQAAYYNRMADAARQGLDNIPYVRVDCGRTAYLIALAYGCPVRVNEHAVSAAPIAFTPEEVKAIQRPERIWERGLYPEIFRRMREFEDRMGSVAFVPADTQSPFDVLTEIVQMESALMMAYDDPDALKGLLQKLTDSIAEVTLAQREAVTNWAYGNDYPLPRGIHLSDDDAAFLSPELYEEFCAPFSRQLSKRFGGVTLHCCMRYWQNVPVMSRMEGIMGMDPQPRFHSLEELLPSLAQVPFWRIFWLPDLDDPLAYYKDLIDRTQDICGLMLEIQCQDREQALRLAWAVKNYAQKRGRG